MAALTSNSVADGEFAALISNLELPADTTSIPLNGELVLAVELVLDQEANLDTAKDGLFQLLDRTQDGTLSKLEWKNFVAKWRKSGSKPLIEYVKERTAVNGVEECEPGAEEDPANYRPISLL